MAAYGLTVQDVEQAIRSENAEIPGGRVEGDIVVAGIPGGEATIKTYSRLGAEVTLTPANPTMERTSIGG